MITDPPTARPETRTRTALAFLAPAALGLLPALLLAAVTADKNEAYEWAQHRLTGLGFAAAFLFLFLGGRWRRSATTALAGTVVAAAIALLIWREHPVGFHPWFLAAGALVAGGYWFSRRTEPGLVPEAIAVGGGAVLSTWIVSSLWWWQSILVPLGPWVHVVVFLAATAAPVGVLCLLTREPVASRTGGWNRVIDVVVLGVLAAALLRTNELDPTRFPHHWSVYTAPADMVREGGWLLANVPSQYGFLSTLTLAALPAGDRFVALFWLGGALNWVAGGILYFVLKAWLPRWWWQLVAGLATVGCAAFLCGEAPILSGPLLYPSVGAMRFIWVYLLLGFLLWQTGREGTAGLDRPRMLRIGSGLWLLGVLWSVESAAYVTAAWLPAATLLALPPAVEPLGRGDRLRAFLTASARALLRPAVWLAATLGVLAGYYGLRLGHAPDVTAYWEYAAAFSAGFGALLMDPQGSVWVLLLLHTTILATLLDLELDRQRGSLALTCAAWGTLWPISTYFVARSHSNNVANLAPVLLLLVGVLGHVWRRGDRRGLGTPWIWLLAPAFVGGMLWLVLTNTPGLKRQLDTYAVQPGVAALLPAATDGQAELLATCLRLRPGRYSIIGATMEKVEAAETAAPHADWLPLRSLPLFNPLAPDRRHFYLDAYARGPGAGWLILPRAHDRESLGWLFDYIDRRYTVETSLEHGGWVAHYYVPRPAPAAAAAGK